LRDNRLEILFLVQKNHVFCFVLNFQALKLNSKSAKALYRRGKAKEGLNEWASAMADLKWALKLSRNNKVIQRDILCLRKLMLNYLRKEKVWCRKMFPRHASNQK
jgi:hypothetical protein